MFDVTALGELLIDFTPHGKSSSGMNLFEQNPGGAPCNVLAALNKCGLKTSFIGKVGNDMHGIFLKNTLETAGINTDGLIVDDSVFTTLAFVSLNDAGERNFSFARKPGADTCLKESEVKVDILEQSKVFHIGSLSLTDEPSKSATLFAIKKAKESGCIISYDPNYRAALWSSKDAAISEMRRILPYVDVMKMSDEETALLTGIQEPKDAARYLVENGIPLVAVTLGAAGAFVCAKEHHVIAGSIVPGFKSQVVDTTGAGDSFWGGFLYKLIQSQKSPSDISLTEAIDFARFANAFASLCVEKRGGIPAMPTLEAVEARLQTMSY